MNKEKQETIEKLKEQRLFLKILAMVERTVKEEMKGKENAKLYN